MKNLKKLSEPTYIYQKERPLGPNLAPNRPNQLRPPFPTNIKGTFHRIELPEKLAFNAGLVALPNSSNYVLSYRPDEYTFNICLINDKFKLISNPVNIPVNYAADPRLIYNNDLHLIYSSGEDGIESVRGLTLNNDFSIKSNFKISKSGRERQKNWMPFIHNGEILLIGSINPQLIYDLSGELVSTIKWDNPWIFNEISLRGNTPCCQLDSGDYLVSFHSTSWTHGYAHYDNGMYLMNSSFKPIKCMRVPYLSADLAREKPGRNPYLRCIFPVGMVVEGERVLISYGENDSCVKIFETSLESIMNNMVELY